MSETSKYQDLFSGHVKRIIKQSLEIEEESKENSELLKTSTLYEDADILYQPVKLVKHMKDRFIDGDTIPGLVKTEGLELLEPDTEYKGLLRHLKYNPDTPELNCEILIVVAMYNEKAEEFTNTMEGIADNLSSFSKYGVPPNKIACCIIIDGVNAFFKMLHEKNAHQKFFEQFLNEDDIKRKFKVDDVNKCKIPGEQDEDEFAHVFMSTTEFDGFEYPVQILFAIKEKNLRKLNTHLWFFGGFCEHIQPKYVILLDVGTRPLHKSLFYMYEAMKTDENIAGCCGEIIPMDFKFFNFVVSAQFVEYKFAHIFDKALESVFGYITVLPGAFSAYQWRALQGDPLWKDYFKPICHPEVMNCFQSNIYLAEDRVLCLALVSKANEKFRLRYIKKSEAETDVPETISGLLAQRRRWINGSWFALIDAVKKFRLYYKSKHNFCQKIIFTIEMIYYWVNIFFSWFMVGSFFLVFAITARKFFVSNSDFDVTNPGEYFISGYVTMLIIVTVLSLSVRVARVETLFNGIAAGFSLYMIFAVILMINFIVSNDFEQEWALIAVLAGISMFVIIILANCCIMDILKGVTEMTLMTPTYVNLFLIYSICNTHDCTWGNRPGGLNEEEKKRREDFKAFRAKWCLVWILSNVSFAYVLNALEKDDDQAWYIYIIAVIGGFLLGFRTIFGLMYILQEKCKKSLKKVDEKELLEKQKKIVEGEIQRIISEESQIENKIEDKIQSKIDDTFVEESSKKVSVYPVDYQKYEEKPVYLVAIDHALEEKQMSYSEIAKFLNMDTERVEIIHQGQILPDEHEMDNIMRLNN